MRSGASLRSSSRPCARTASRPGAAHFVAEFLDEEWRLVSELAGYPNRLLVTATTEAGETYAEVAHEAIFRRWGKLREWVAAEREFLGWRSGLEAARRAWEKTPDKEKIDALLMGFALQQAQSWLAERKDGIPKADRDFIALSGSELVAAERAFRTWRSGCDRARDIWAKKAGRDKSAALLTGSALTEARDWLAKRSEDIEEATRTFIDESRKADQRRKRQVQALIGVMVAAIVLVTAAWQRDWLEQETHAVASWLKERIYAPIYAMRNATPLDAAQESALKPGDALPRECRDCPEMTVVPAGHFLMGSPKDQGDDREHPQHEVTIARPFAVAKFALTFDEWDACAANGPCNPDVSDAGWGRGRQPVINVSWDDAQTYVRWLSRVTGKPYRLLSEAEYEYAARAEGETEYPWGPDIKLDGKEMANCNGCGGEWGGKRTAPVGKFPANAFGLYDMVGNVWEWTEDCWHGSYAGGPPTDGSAWTTGSDCKTRVVRGGSWVNYPDILRSADRDRDSSVVRYDDLGFRVARTLTP